MDNQKEIIRRNAGNSTIHYLTSNLATSVKSSTSLQPTKHSGRATKLPPCDDDKLMIYLAEIQAINPESIINLSTIDDLDVLCK